MNDSLKLNMFFPSELLSITSVDYDDSSIHIKMQSEDKTEIMINYLLRLSW